MDFQKWELFSGSLDIQRFSSRAAKRLLNSNILDSSDSAMKDLTL